MRLICYGISFHDTALKDRELLAFTGGQQQGILRAIQQSDFIHEGLILCTCNRTEIYLYAKKDYDTKSFIESAIESVAAGSRDIWAEHHHVYEDTEAVRHLFTVGSGLDSQMIGESQVIRQLKDAYIAAMEARTTKFFFHRLMHRAFKTSKAVHTQTDINCGAVSISAAAVELAREKLNLAGANVLLIGAGENAGLAARYLVKAGIKTLTVASRTLDTATDLTAKLKMGTPCTLIEIPDHIDKADLIVCSTAAETPILTEAKYKYLLSKDNRPVVILDIAVPRDVDEEIAKIDNVQLYNIDDLNQQVQSNLDQRSSQIPRAMAIVDRHVEHFDRWLKSLNVTDIVASMVDEYQTLAADEVGRYRSLFPDLNADELQKFADSLVKKVLHGPIKYLKDSIDDDLASDQLQAMDLIKKMLLDVDRKRGGQ